MTNFDFIKAHLTIDDAVRLIADCETCKSKELCEQKYPFDEHPKVTEKECHKVIKQWLSAEYVVKEEQLPGQLSIDDYMKGKQ